MLIRALPTGGYPRRADRGSAAGALYHHFDGKRDLLRAVYEQLESEVLREGAEMFLDHCSRSSRSRTPCSAAARREAGETLDGLSAALAP